MGAKCKHCGKIARYYRVTSGEILCIHCLENGIYKQIRKYFTLYNAVKRGYRIAYLIRCDMIAQTTSLLKILSKFVRALNLEIMVLVPESVLNEVQRIVHSLDIGRVKIVSYSFKVEPRSFVELLKLNEILLKNVASKYGLDSALSPIFRDELSLTAFLGVVKASKHIFSEALPLKRQGSFVIARPFYFVTLFDAAALAYLYGIENLFDYSIRYELSRDELVVRKYFLEVVWSSRELLYSSRKTVELLQSYILSRSTQCDLCLAYSDSNPCPTCSYLLRRSQQGLYRTSE